MTAPPDADLEGALRRGLAAVADSVGALSTDPALIIERGRALRTRRRHASIAVLGVCAVLALSLPVGLWRGSVKDVAPDTGYTRTTVRPTLISARPTPSNTLAYSGTMAGVSWQVYAEPAATAGLDGKPMGCITVVVSGGPGSQSCSDYWDGTYPPGVGKSPVTNALDGSISYGPANDHIGGPFLVMGTFIGHPARITAVLPDGSTYDYTPIQVGDTPFYAVLTPPTNHLKLYAYDAAGHEVGQTDVSYRARS